MTKSLSERIQEIAAMHSKEEMQVWKNYNMVQNRIPSKGVREMLGYTTYALRCVEQHYRRTYPRS